MGDNRIAIGKSSEMHRNTSGIHCGIMDTGPYCVKRLDYQVVWLFYVFVKKGRMLLQEKWKDFMEEMGLEDMSDPMEELPGEVMLYRWENE